MTRGRIIILEDDVEMRSILIRGLSEEDFVAEGVGTGREFVDLVSGARPDALVIDIGLPDADGRDVCQALRAKGIQAPVLFLTARHLLPDRLTAFAAGGDDYLTKPFAFAEVVARLTALIRRSGAAPKVAVGELTVDPSAHAASCGGKSVPLTPTEFRLLSRLASAPGHAVRRRALVEVAWPHGAIVHENTLDAYMARLRRKLARLECAPAITTVRGVGYMLQ